MPSNSPLEDIPYVPNQYPLTRAIVGGDSLPIVKTGGEVPRTKSTKAIKVRKKASDAPLKISKADKLDWQIFGQEEMQSSLRNRGHGDSVIDAVGRRQFGKSYIPVEESSKDARHDDPLDGIVMGLLEAMSRRGITPSNETLRMSNESQAMRRGVPIHELPYGKTGSYLNRYD